MDIDLLRTFLEVRRLGNFRSAAENLHVTQAAVSQRIKHLESILGTPVFMREKNNIAPTPAGEQLVNAAEAIVATWSEVQRDIGFHAIPASMLSIGADAGVWELAGNACLNTFSLTAPDTRLSAEVLSEEIVRKRLAAQTLDIGFLSKVDDVDAFAVCPLKSFQLALHSRAAKKLALAINDPYVYVEWGSEVAYAMKAVLAPACEILLRTSDYGIARRFIENCDASALLPVGQFGAKAKLNVISDGPSFERDIAVVWHKKNPQSDLIEQYAAAAVARMA